MNGLRGWSRHPGGLSDSHAARLVIAPLSIGNTILLVPGLSFLGRGPQSPMPEWGVMLAESRDVLRVASGRDPIQGRAGPSPPRERGEGVWLLTLALTQQSVV